MNIGRQAIGFVESADAHEAESIACARVVAPESDTARRTAGDLLSFSAMRWRVHDLGRAFQQDHTVGFDQSVQCEGRSRFTLTPAAMTAVHEQRFGRHSIAHRPTSASALHWKNHYRYSLNSPHFI